MKAVVAVVENRSFNENQDRLMSGGGLADVDNYKYTREHDEGGGYRKTIFPNTGCIRVI